MARTSGQLGVGASDNRGAERRFGIGQWLTLTRRYFEIKLKDTRNTALLLVQAPVIAVILAMIVGKSLNDSKTIFIAAIISIWFGANAIREIVSKRYLSANAWSSQDPSTSSRSSLFKCIALVQVRCSHHPYCLQTIAGAIRSTDVILT